MSMHLSSERFSLLLDDARFLVSRTGTHKDQLESLVAEAEAVVRSAEAAVDGATQRNDDVRQLLSTQLVNATERAHGARRLCVTARQDHVVALRLLGHLDPVDCDDDQASARQSRAVLIVDDSDDVREIVARVLESAGFAVRTAANGLEGLIAAYEMRPGVIIMDVSMPVLDGIEATRLIKSFKATRGARIIAFTADPSIERLADQRFAAVLRKPATPDLVLAAVQRAATA